MWERWRGGYQTASPSWLALAIDRIFGMYSGVQPGIVSSVTLTFLAFQPPMSCSSPFSIQSDTSDFLTMCARTVTCLAPDGAAAAGLAALVSLGLVASAGLSGGLAAGAGVAVGAAGAAQAASAAAPTAATESASTRRRLKLSIPSPPQASASARTRPYACDHIRAGRRRAQAARVGPGRRGVARRSVGPAGSARRGRARRAAGG